MRNRILKSVGPCATIGTDVSVVVQGAWAPGQTERALLSVRQTLPGAQVIFSGWAGGVPDAADALADIVVETTDPGATIFDGCPDVKALAAQGAANANLHRQILSTRRGIAAADRPLVLKMRSDMLLDHAGFLDWWGAFRGRPRIGGILRDRIVTTSARHPERSMAYYVQDFVQFGHIEDVTVFWDAPPPPDGTQLAAMGAARAAGAMLQAEQYLVTSLLARCSAPGYVALERHSDCTRAVIEATKTLVAMNFLCLDTHVFGASFLKPSVAWIDDRNTTMFTLPRTAKATMSEWRDWVVEHGGDALSDLPTWADAVFHASEEDASRRQAIVRSNPLRESDALSGFLLAAAADWALRVGDGEQAGDAVALLEGAGCRDAVLHDLKTRLARLPSPA